MVRVEVGVAAGQGRGWVLGEEIGEAGGEGLGGKGREE